MKFIIAFITGGVALAASAIIPEQTVFGQTVAGKAFASFAQYDDFGCSGQPDHAHRFAISNENECRDARDAPLVESFARFSCDSSGNLVVDKFKDSTCHEKYDNVIVSTDMKSACFAGTYINWRCPE